MGETSLGCAVIVGSVGHMASGFRRTIRVGVGSRVVSSQLVFGGTGADGSLSREATERKESGCWGQVDPGTELCDIYIFLQYYLFIYLFIYLL